MSPMLPFGDALSIRLTGHQLEIEKAGLRVAVCASWSKRMMSPCSNAETCQCTLCRFHFALVDLVKQLNSVECAKRHRLRLNLVQILTCQLALRNVAHPTRIIRRHFGISPTRGRHQQLAAKLENLRKRAKRQYQRTYIAEAYTELRKGWHEYLDCLRQALSGRPRWSLRCRRGPVPARKPAADRRPDPRRYPDTSAKASEASGSRRTAGSSPALCEVHPKRKPPDFDPGMRPPS
jgi:hypothetical protein